MTRKIADCRDMPSDIGCTLTLTGEEDEIVLAAAHHAATMHGHTDDESSAQRSATDSATPRTPPGRLVRPAHRAGLVMSPR